MMRMLKTKSNRCRRASIMSASALGVLSLATITLSGCGFQLVGLGSNKSPLMHQLELNVANDTPQNIVATQIRHGFEQRGVQLTDNAPIELNIGNASFNETQLNYTGDGGTQQRRVVLSVPYSVQRTSDNAYLSDQQTIELTGGYTTSTNQLLQRDSVRDQVYQQLAQEATTQLIARMSAIAEHENASKQSQKSTSSDSTQSTQHSTQ